MELELHAAGVFPDDEEAFKAMRFGKDCLLDPSSRLDMARWVVFLYTDQDYPTKPKDSKVLICSTIFFGLLSLIVVSRDFAWKLLLLAAIVVFARCIYNNRLYWPFGNRALYRKALAQPKLLNGRRV